MDATERYSRHVAWSPEDACFVATVAEFPQISAFGDSVAEAIEELGVVLESVVEIYEEDGKQLPEPLFKEQPDLPSGKFQLRVPRHVHKRLADEARREGTSLNLLVNSFIAEGLGRREALQRLNVYELAQRTSAGSRRPNWSHDASGAGVVVAGAVTDGPKWLRASLRQDAVRVNSSADTVILRPKLRKAM